MTVESLWVELVAPALVGGADKGRCDDPPILRPPSLRGQLRLWSRALGGAELEEELWGSAEGGQRVRLLSVLYHKRRETAPMETYALLPHKPQRTALDMIAPGARFLLRFGLPPGVDRRRLQAVVWTWLHLGAVGRRARRGYGSCLWLPGESDLLADLDPSLRPWPRHALASRGALEEHLRNGLEWVCSELAVPGTDPRSANGDTDRLLTTDQVFVGRVEGRWERETEPPPGHDALQAKIKGLSSDHRGPDPDAAQLGSGVPREPSPMLWRLFPDGSGDSGRSRDAAATGYWTVMTWFPTGFGSASATPSTPPILQAAEGSYRYLHGTLGFESSLTGQPLAG